MTPVPTKIPPTTTEFRPFGAGGEPPLAMRAGSPRWHCGCSAAGKQSHQLHRGRTSAPQDGTTEATGITGSGAASRVASLESLPSRWFRVTLLFTGGSLALLYVLSDAGFVSAVVCLASPAFFCGSAGNKISSLPGRLRAVVREEKETRRGGGSSVW